MSKLVTVVIPCYKQAHFLEECIESVLAQTYTPIEIVIVNDGSPDETEAVCAAFGEQVKCITQPNLGLSAARNTGIRAALGEYIALLDSDDICRSQRIAKQVAFLEERPTFGMVVSDAYLQRGSEIIGLKSELSKKPKNHANFRWETVAYCPTPSTMLIRRECFKKIGYFEPALKGMGGEDWLFAVEMSLHYPMGFIDEPLIDYRLHETNKTKNVATINAGNRLASKISVESERFSRYPAHFRARLLFYRFATAWQSNKPEAIGCFARGVLTAPNEIGYGLKVIQNRLGSRR